MFWQYSAILRSIKEDTVFTFKNMVYQNLLKLLAL
jgi:hypothetical protein